MDAFMNMLKLGASTTALIAGFIATEAAAQSPSPGPIQTADAQPTPQAPDDETPPPQAAVSDETDEDIVVTGTSIRGVAPVGSSLTSVGREEIENTGAQTIQQILKTIPQITGAGAAGQGTAGSSAYAPTIHSLGSSASNSTLILIDGHRFPLQVTFHPLSDPNIIAPMAIERVEVIADGASSVYGSDAVAGVINFITRRNYEGLEAQGQLGFGDNYRTYSAGLLWGTRWETGSVMLSYGYSNRSPLASADRDFLRADHRPQGGTSFLSFNCPVATIQPQGTSVIYLSPTAPTSVSNAATNATCDNSIYGDLIAEETRHNVFGRIQQEFGSRFKASLDFVYSDRQNIQNTARGTATVTVFRTGAQANPFYVNPPGVTPGTTAGDRQTIRWSADELLGPGAFTDEGDLTYYAAFNAEYEFNENLRLSLVAVAGRDESYNKRFGVLCGSCVNLALNGTTNTSGSLTQASIPATGLIVTGLPLTAANALDVWNPAATNRTSPQVLARLVDSLQNQRYVSPLRQARLILDGSLFELPGGTVRFALGGELISSSFVFDRARPNNTGPATTGSEQFHLEVGRSVRSAFAEVQLPIIGEENDIPLVRSFDLNLSARHDNYSDVGSTTNPRIAANWEPVRGLRFRGNWSKSFVAPPISSLGDPAQNGLANFGGTEPVTNANASIPIALYPLAAQLPGCMTPGQVTCTIGTSTVSGVSYNSGNTNLQPQRGSGWSIGFDVSPDVIPGLRIGVTLFNAKFTGGVTSPELPSVINTAGLNNLLTIYPTGVPPAVLAALLLGAPQTAVLPTTIYFVQDRRQRNVLNLTIQGVDASVNYRLPTSNAGTFTAGASISYFTKFDQNIAGGPSFSVLNTTGFNGTFPSIQTQARANVGWEHHGFSADFFANYIGSYRNWSSTTVAPLTRDANGNPNGGGDKVKSNVLLDMHLAYRLPSVGPVSESEIYVDVTNLFDREPPFFNRAQGYDSFGANPIGRVISVGARVKF